MSSVSYCYGWRRHSLKQLNLPRFGRRSKSKKSLIISQNPCVFCGKVFFSFLLSLASISQVNPLKPKVITNNEELSASFARAKKRQSRTTWWHKILSEYVVYESYERFILLFIKSTPFHWSGSQLSGEIWNYGNKWLCVYEYVLDEKADLEPFACHVMSCGCCGNRLKSLFVRRKPSWCSYQRDHSDLKAAPATSWFMTER